MGRNILYALFLIGVLLIVAAAVSVALALRGGGGEVPEHTILEADFTGGLVEYVPEDPVAKALLANRGTVLGTTAALERAADDDRVVALVARVGSGFGLPGKVQELRDAILHFRSKGKRAIAYVETFGFGYAGTTNYYLATAFDEIYVLPIGSVSLSGLALEVQFLKGALDKLGIEAELDSRAEYKTAKTVYTETHLTPPNREAYERLVTSQFERIAVDIATARALALDEVEAIARRGMLQSDEAFEARLIDGIAYRDEVFAKVEDASPGAERLFLGTYAARTAEPPAEGPVIGLVYGVGAVVQGPSTYDPLRGSATMGADTDAAALRSAAADDEVEAIVFRIDSGGGSAVASQVIWRETLRAQEKGKPVIASMSDVAGSGGYFVAMGADKIVAQPGTITGSIGVLGGKLVTKALWDKLGISFDEVKTHPNAAMWNGSRRFTPEQSAQFGHWLDRIYEIFTSGVAAGRNLTIEQVHEVARGRIWTGADALDRGLVDALGGFPEAIRLAKEAAGIDADTPVELRVFPRPKTATQLIVERLTGRGDQQDSGDAAAAIWVDTLERLQPLGRAVAELGLAPAQGELRMQLPASLVGP
jgi:protease-4